MKDRLGKIGILFFLGLSLAGGAEEGAPPPSEVDTALPQLQLEKKKTVNLCPLCKRPREVCYEEYLKAQVDPTQKGKICPVYREDFGRIKTRPWPCPICGAKVNLPILPTYLLRSKDCDADLCMHPVGLVKFDTELVLCPGCGFAAYQHDFRKEQPPEIVSWVQTTLTQPFHQQLRNMIAFNLKLEDRKLPEIFAHQEDLPNIVRCSHAFFYYQLRKADAPFLAKLAWMTAWSCRREVSGPIMGKYAMDSVKKILDRLKRDKGDEKDLEEREKILRGYFTDSKSFSFFDRQIIRLLLASYYNRLGLNEWARICLRQTEAAALKTYGPNEKDPFFEEATGTAEERRDEADWKRAVLRAATHMRLELIDQEERWLQIAIELILQGLREKRYPPEEMASYVYLVGEFERRCGHFTRALFWLEAAAKLLGREPRIEHFAPQQIALMREYVKQLKVTPPPHPSFAEDQALLTQITNDVTAAMAVKAKPEESPEDIKACQ